MAEAKSTRHGSIIAAATALLAGVSYAVLLVLRHSTLIAQLSEHPAFGRSLTAQQHAIAATAVDATAVLWVVLPAALLACALSVRWIGVGHVALLGIAMLSVPALPIASAILTMDPVLITVAAVGAIAVVATAFLLLHELRRAR